MVVLFFDVVKNNKPVKAPIRRVIRIFELSVFFYRQSVSILYLISNPKKLQVPYYMKKRFILYKINQVPGGGSTVIYVREIRYKKPVFTSFKPEAMRLGLFRAIYFSVYYNVSTLPEKLV